MLTYEDKLSRDLNWALNEGGLYFECRNQLHITLRRLVKVLDNTDTEYVLAGAVAMFFHGFRRFTESIDVILTPHGLTRAYEVLEAHGFVRDESANHIRDSETGVKIEFLVDGLLPQIYGLGRLVIPNPQEVSVTIDGLQVARLETLVTMKLDSGQASHRLKDVADVQSLIQHCGLTPDFANRLDSRHQAQYQQLWTYAQKAAADDY